MPYINVIKRTTIDPHIVAIIDQLVTLQIDDETDNMEANINYIFASILKKCYGNSYSEITEALGILSSVQMEYYRTVATPIENQTQYDNNI